MRWLVTGGAGFIGSAFIRYGLQHGMSHRIVNIDSLTYAANRGSLKMVEGDPRYRFEQGDIRDQNRVESLCVEEKIEGIVHFAAESHVDRSIDSPRAFYDTNVGGTLALLEVVRRLPHLHFHQVSTDEVFGSLNQEGFFTEDSPYRPNSPYAASKAAADHFVRAYAHTYGLSTTISHCTNNYGPWQHEEKLIPRLISACQQKHPLPIYGTGLNVRDWIFVDDHVEAIWKILETRRVGETYAIGGNCEKSNLEVVHALIELFAQIRGDDPQIYRDLICFVPDRLGHDFRYAINGQKMRSTLQWQPTHSFQMGLQKTLQWYEKDYVHI